MFNFQKKAIVKYVEKWMSEQKYYTYNHKITQFSKTANAELFKLALDNETLISQSENYINDLLSEINIRFAKANNIESNKVKVYKNHKEFMGKNRFYEGRLDPNGLLSIFIYNKKIYKKLIGNDNYSLNVLFNILHESRHSHQYSKIRDVLNNNIDESKCFLRNEYILRACLKYINNSYTLWSTDYQLDYLEYDANTYTVSFFCKAIQNGTIKPDKKLYSFLAELLIKVLIPDVQVIDNAVPINKAIILNHEKMLLKFKEKFGPKCDKEYFTKYCMNDLNRKRDDYKMISELYYKNLENTKYILNKWLEATNIENKNEIQNLIDTKSFNDAYEKLEIIYDNSKIFDKMLKNKIKKICKLSPPHYNFDTSDENEINRQIENEKIDDNEI